MSVDVKAKQPNTLRLKYVGIDENNISNGVFWDNRGGGILLIRWVAIKMQFPPQKKKKKERKRKEKKKKW